MPPSSENNKTLLSDHGGWLSLNKALFLDFCFSSALKPQTKKGYWRCMYTIIYVQLFNAIFVAIYIYIYSCELHSLHLISFGFTMYVSTVIIPHKGGQIKPYLATLGKGFVPLPLCSCSLVFWTSCVIHRNRIGSGANPLASVRTSLILIATWPRSTSLA